MDLQEALKKMRNWAVRKRDCSVYANACFSYLRAIPEAIETGVYYGSAKNGLRTQLIYAMSNAQYWRGEDAKEAKAVIKKWIDDNEETSS